MLKFSIPLLVTLLAISNVYAMTCSANQENQPNDDTDQATYTMINNSARENMVATICSNGSCDGSDNIAFFDLTVLPESELSYTITLDATSETSDYNYAVVKDGSTVLESMALETNRDDNTITCED